MLPLATTEQIKELDRIAIEERGIPSLELMENAAAAVAGAVMDLVGPVEEPRREEGIIGGAVSFAVIGGPRAPTDEERAQMEALREIVESRNTDPVQRIGVFCGPGNNGGDGIAAARILLEEGYRVRAFLVGGREKMTPDARAMEARLMEAGGALEPFDLVLDENGAPENLTDALQRAAAWLSTCDCYVDALFGVGLKRPLEGAFRTAVLYMNGGRCPVVSCDLPSGVDGDTGRILGEAVRAARTVTFTCAKPGLYLGAGAGCAGEVEVTDIGIPHDLQFKLARRCPEPMEAVPPSMRWNLPRRPADGHKGDFGKIFILGGSEGYTGAPVLAARAALRTGAGLVYVGVPRDVYPIVAVKCDEAMALPLPDNYEEIHAKVSACDVAVIGPGLGRRPETEGLVRALLTDLNIPVVLDADGINALAGHIDILDKRSAPTILTPHDGEFARLTGRELPIGDKLSAARDFAKAHRCTLVLKGRGTVTAAPDGHIWVNGTGNPGMAVGGSGDVLAGMIAALLGQKHLQNKHTGLSETAALAVWLHGGAGDLCARRLGEYAMLPTDMIGALPEILKENETR